MSVPERMEPAAWDFQRIEDGAECLSYYVFRNEEMASAVQEEKTLSLVEELFQGCGERCGDWWSRYAVDALRRSELSAPHCSTNFGLWPRASTLGFF